MREIHCPKDIGFENTFEGDDCEREQHYNNCYHCWTSAIAGAFQKKRGNGRWIPVIDKWGDVVTTTEGYECSECGLFNADKDNYCPNCGVFMKGDKDVRESD